MRLLKKTLIAVGLLVLLKVVGILLEKYSPMTILFHRNLIIGLQLFIFLWLVIGILVDLFVRKDARKAGRITWIVLILIVAGFELLFTYWLKNPTKVPASMYGSVKEYYIHNYRHIVQVERSCAEFDSMFFYRLRPNNQCTFGNVEFSNTIKTNSKGLRDDEASLSRPDVICIGDSYTMGWGVEQDQSFPSLLEKNTGLKVLNAGMSSFGTVRELRKLSTLDTSNCKWVVLQYCGNDVEENKTYVDKGFNLQTSGAAAYDTLVRRSEWNHAYYPGKAFFSIGMFRIKQAIKDLRKKDTTYVIPLGPGQVVTIPESAKMFAEILRHNATLLKNRSLIVLYVAEGRKDFVFVESVKQLLSTSPYKEEITSPVHFLNTSSLLDSSDNYVLDDHYRAKGHEKIAAAIKGIIKP